MPDQTIPKDVDPSDVALAPGERIYEDIYKRLLSEVCARIDQRIADIEAQAAVPEPVDSSVLAAMGDEPVSLRRSARRRPLSRVAIGLVASAGLVGAVVTLARTQTGAMWSATERIDAAIQSVRESLPKGGSTGGPETSTASSSSDVTQTDRVSPSSTSPPFALAPSASPLPDTAAAQSGSPSSAMAEAPPGRDGPSAAERDLAPLIEKIAQDVGDLKVGLQDLKASQERASRDHTRAIEQLQASRDPLARAFGAARSEAPGGAPAARPAPRPAQARAPRF